MSVAAWGQRVHEARRRGLDPDERRRVMDAVALRTGDVAPTPEPTEVPE